MPREQLLGLAADVDRLLAAGASAAAGHDGLARRGRTLCELGQKVAALNPVADAVERVVTGNPRQAGSAFLDLLVMSRQLRASLTAAGVEGSLQPAEESGPWQTPAPVRDLILACGALDGGEGAVSTLRDLAGRKVAGDLRLVGPALEALEGSNAAVADAMAEGVLPALGRAVLPDLLTKFNLKGKSPDARRLRAICRIDTKTGADLCRKGLTEGSPQVKVESLECLPDVGRPGEAEKAGLELCKEKKKEVRLAALTALRKATSDEALDALVAALADEDGEVSRQALQVLAELPHPKTTDRLVREIEGQSAALPPPVPNPKKGAKPAARKAAEKAREERGKVVEQLECFIEALGERKDTKNPRALKTLLALARHAEADVRSAAVRALAELGPGIKEVVPALAEAVKDPEETVGYAAVESLAALPPEQREPAVPALMERARDLKADDNLVGEALEMLPEHMKRFGKQILDLLKYLLQKSKDHYVLSSAVEAVGKIGEPARGLVPDLLALAGKEMYLNYESVFAKVEPDGTTSIPALIRLLGEKKAPVRANALEGLTSYGPMAKDAEVLVEKLAKDRDWNVKYHAAKALAAIRNEQ